MGNETEDSIYLMRKVNFHSRFKLTKHMIEVKKKNRETGNSKFFWNHIHYLTKTQGKMLYNPKFI